GGGGEASGRALPAFETRYSVDRGRSEGSRDTPRRNARTVQDETRRDEAQVRGDCWRGRREICRSGESHRAREITADGRPGLGDRRPEQRDVIPVPGLQAPVSRLPLCR